MAIISVNGTSIQAAADGAQPNDTLAVGAGGYAGFTVRKPLKIIGAGDATRINGAGTTVHIQAPDVMLQGMAVSGATGANSSAVIVEGTAGVNSRATLLDMLIEHAECYGFRSYQQSAVTLRRVRIQDVASGVELHRYSGGSTFESVDIRDCKRMVTDIDGGANGGDAYVFYQTAGPIMVKGGTIERCRAPSNIYKPVDGGYANIFGTVADLTFEDVVIRDVVNLTETGQPTAGTEPRRVVFRRVNFFGNDSPDPYFISSGAYIRTGIDFTFDSCEFHKVDWCAFLLIGGPGTNFGGVVSGFRAINNKIWLSDALAYRIDLPNSVIAQWDGNQVYIPAGFAGKVAQVRGTQTSDLAQFRTLIGQAAPNEYWGPEPVIDPCADIKAERDAALAKFAVATTQRDAYKSQIDRAKVILAEENGLVTPSRKTLRSIINRADTVLSE